MSSYLQVKKFIGTKKTEDLLKGWTPMSCKGKVQQIKAWLKNQSMLSEDQKKKLSQGKDNSPVEAPQASTSATKGKVNPKEQSEGQEKCKGKGKAQVEQALPTELRNSQEREDSHEQCVQYGKNSDGIQKQGGGKNEPIISKEIDLLKIVNNFETCTKELLEKLNNSEYIQQKLGREALQVKETQKTIFGLEVVNKDNIIFYANLCKN
ncbi:hypothetical protein O181_124849 [Austropuccinia psidii MF-1]|uniref:Uncharacterized protein n=1 Tax=Austropuccinia psidii MF-1 TaxID=1389203 RepID=A0A9Q3KQ78_9BASI|nr:hypothetical protein [Austropuccinia psidii MF-1]